jgi:hypothetical protein
MTQALCAILLSIGLTLALPVWVEASACLAAESYNITGTRNRYVATDGSGSTCTSQTPCSLSEAMSTQEAGDTIILVAGTYQLNEFTQNGLFVAVADVTIRGVDQSSCDTTILDGNGMDNAPSGNNPSGAATGVLYGIWSDQPNTTIAHLTIRGIYTHPINFNEGAVNPVLHHVRIQDAGEQHLKINPAGIDNGLIQDTLMGQASATGMASARTGPTTGPCAAQHLSICIIRIARPAIWSMGRS